MTCTLNLFTADCKMDDCSLKKVLESEMCWALVQVHFHGGAIFSVVIGTVAAAAAMMATFVQSRFSEGSGCLLFQALDTDSKQIKKLTRSLCGPSTHPSAIACI